MGITEQECDPLLLTAEPCPAPPVPTAQQILLDKQENHENLPWIFPVWLLCSNTGPPNANILPFSLLSAPISDEGLCHCAPSWLFSCSERSAQQQIFPSYLSVLCQHTFFPPLKSPAHHLWDKEPHLSTQGDPAAN